MYQFFKTYLTIFIIPLFLKTWSSAQTLPTQLETKEALQIVGNFLKEKGSSDWLVDIATSRTSPLTTAELMKEIVKSARANEDVKKSAEIVKLAIEEQKRTGKIDESLAIDPEGWKELIENVENQDDIICLYKKSINVSNEKSDDWRKFLKNISPGYTVHLALDMGQKYVICMKKLQVPNLNSTEMTTIPPTTTIGITNTEIPTNDSKKKIENISTTNESPGGMILDAVMPFVDQIIGSKEKEKNNNNDDDDCESSESDCSDESENSSTDRKSSQSKEFSSFSEESEEFDNTGRRRLIFMDKKKSNDVDEKKEDCNRPIIYLLSNYPLPQPTFGHFFAPGNSLGNLRPSIGVPNYQKKPLTPVFEKKPIFNIPISSEKHKKIYPIRNKITPVSNCLNRKKCPESSENVKKIIPKYKPMPRKSQSKIFSRKELSGQPVSAIISPHTDQLKDRKKVTKLDDLKWIYSNKNNRFNLRLPNGFSNNIKFQLPPRKPGQFNYPSRQLRFQRPQIKPYWMVTQRPISIPPKIISSEFPNGAGNNFVKPFDNVRHDAGDSSGLSSEEISSNNFQQKCTTCLNPCSQPINLKIQVNSPSKEPINVGIFTEPNQNVQVLGGNLSQDEIDNDKFAVRRNFNGMMNSEDESEEDDDSEENDEKIELKKNDYFEDLQDIVDSEDWK